VRKKKKARAPSSHIQEWKKRREKDGLLPEEKKEAHAPNQDVGGRGAKMKRDLHPFVAVGKKTGIRPASSQQKGKGKLEAHPYLSQ